MAAAAGVSALMPAFWSQVEVSTSAPRAAGRCPPITKPKNRGPAVPASPGSAVVASSSSTATGSAPDSGIGPSKASSICSNVARGHTGRSRQPGEEALRELLGPGQHPSRVVHGVTIVRLAADKVTANRSGDIL